MMNERIKELELQAYVEVTKSWRDPSSGYVQEITGKEFSREQFAKLIVRECAQFVEDKFDFIGDEIIVKEKMLEYFGVEND